MIATIQLLQESSLQCFFNVCMVESSFLCVICLAFAEKAVPYALPKVAQGLLKGSGLRVLGQAERIRGLSGNQNRCPDKVRWQG